MKFPKDINLTKIRLPFQSIINMVNIKLDAYKSADNIITIKESVNKCWILSISEYEDFYNFYYQIFESENKTHITLSK